VQETAESLGVSDRVLFLGKQNSVAELLACTDLFVLPSETEAFGLVALEAMACGVPVIATRTGGLPEVVEDGESGYLAAVGDIEAMADAGIGLLSDRAQWRRFSAAAREGAEKYSSTRVVPEYESFYTEVLNR
jgi:L-malate glycosyltransferase